MSKETSTNEVSYNVPIRSSFSSPIRRIKKWVNSPGRVPVVGSPVKEYVQPQNDMSWRGQIEKMELSDLTATKIYDLVIQSGSRLVIIVDTEGNPIRLTNGESIVPSGITILPPPSTLADEETNGIDLWDHLSDANPPDTIPAIHTSLEKNEGSVGQEVIILPIVVPTPEKIVLPEPSKDPLRAVFEKKIRIAKTPVLKPIEKIDTPEEAALKKKESFEQTNYFLSLSPERQEQLKKQHKKTGIPMEVLVQRPEKRPPRNVQVMQRDVEEAISSQYAAIHAPVWEPTESTPL